MVTYKFDDYFLVLYKWRCNPTYFTSFKDNYELGNNLSWS